MNKAVGIKDKLPPPNIIDFYLNIITNHRTIIIESIIARVTDLTEPSEHNCKKFD